jgi:hypothetical protein
MARLATLMVTTLLVLAGCGGSESGGEGRGDASEVRGDADPDDVEVIDDWSSALRKGDVDAASEYFALPSIAENGSALLRIDTRDDAELFNRSLPCGAELIRASSEGELTLATFRLTERPGPGACGAGTGGLAKTSFLIEDGLIVEWRRVGIGSPPATGEVA